MLSAPLLSIHDIKVFDVRQEDLSAFTERSGRFSVQIRMIRVPAVWDASMRVAGGCISLDSLRSLGMTTTADASRLSG
jgi:hypothetical protein